MPRTIIHAVVGEAGTEPIRLDLRRDLTLLTNPVVTLEVAKPDATAASWTMVQVPATSEGYAHVKYLPSASDFDQPGLWIARPKLAADGGFVEYLESFRIQVASVAS